MKKKEKKYENKSRTFKETAITVGVIAVLGLGFYGVVAHFANKSENTDITNPKSTTKAVETAPPETAEPEIVTEVKKISIPKTKSKLNTGNLSAYSTEYEGKKGTGDFNYGEALQKSILFYDLQRSGELPEQVRCNWRSDSGLTDGSDVGLDLTGGFYDAGDNVKFNLPMAYTAAMLSWSVTEDEKSYKESKQLEYIKDNIKWVNDYLIKCHPEDNVYYYQVGDGNADHSWWGPAEVMHMDRPSYKVDKNSPGSTVSAEGAASLAACSIVFSDDKKYSKTCLEHAEKLYKFAEETKSDDGYTAANGFYNSWSGFNDELSWAAVWLYKATGNKDYLKKAEKYFDEAGGNIEWTQCWDDVYMGSCLLLAKETKNEKYKKIMEKNLNFWINDIHYTSDGLAWCDQWGSLRYAESEAFLAAVYSDSDICPKADKDKYWKFAESQVNYALGSSGRSFVIGFGENPPEHPHHRTAHASWSNSMNEPSEHRHILFGALVGGPDSNGGYEDVITNYTTNEVACDYNAGFTGALAKMYKKYGGQTLKNFGAVENIATDEFSAKVSENASGQGFTEVKAIISNQTAWPARNADSLEFRYFMDLSELWDAGLTADDVSISVNYSQDNISCELIPWNEEKHIYYASADFSGADIYPGGQDAYKKEIQFRIKTNSGTWDPSNDFSYEDLGSSSSNNMNDAVHCGLYDGGELVYGSEPEGKTASKPEKKKKETEPREKKPDTPEAPKPGEKKVNKASGGDLSVELQQENSSGRSNSINFRLFVTNNADYPIAINDLEILYYFTADGAPDKQLSFWCDSASVTEGDSYTPINKVNGSFSEGPKGPDKKADTVLTIKPEETTLLNKNGKLELQIRASKNDWSEFDLSNDYSTGNAEHIVIRSGGKVICGKEP